MKNESQVFSGKLSARAKKYDMNIKRLLNVYNLITRKNNAALKTFAQVKGLQNSNGSRKEG